MSQGLCRGAHMGSTRGAGSLALCRGAHVGGAEATTGVGSGAGAPTSRVARTDEGGFEDWVSCVPGRVGDVPAAADTWLCAWSRSSRPSSPTK
jgi:hypothetical protein